MPLVKRNFDIDSYLKPRDEYYNGFEFHEMHTRIFWCRVRNQRVYRDACLHGACHSLGDCKKSCSELRAFYGKGKELRELLQLAERKPSKN
jgi:hypothetical protein